MMLDNNAQAIFLLTYRITEQGLSPLSSQEYSSLALAVRKANLDGPGALLSMSETELSNSLGLHSGLSLQIRELLNQAGTATLYLDRFFNQGFGLITRTDYDYPNALKKCMLHNAPPYLTFVGDEQILSTLTCPRVVFIKDINDINGLLTHKDRQDLIVIIESTRKIKQLKLFDDFDGRLLFISNIGLTNIIRFPVVRNLLSRGQVQIISTGHLEAKEGNVAYNYLRSIAEALSSSMLHTPESEMNGSETEQFIDYGGTLNNGEERVQEQIAKYHPVALPINRSTDVVNVIPSAMELSTQPQNKVVYTIGHSNHDIEKFISLLQTYGIDILADVRSSPNSKYVPQFNQGNLKRELVKAGIQYLFLGNLLGGRPEDKTVLNSQGQIVREYIEEREWYLEGIRNLEQLVTSGKMIAIMCAEEDPANCHRGYVVSNTLLDDKFVVKHIRQDGKTQIRGSIPAPSDQREIVFE